MILKYFFLEKADFLRKNNQQVTNTIEITQRAEFITRGLIEIIHGPTCILGALRIISICQFYIKISIFEIYEKRRMNTGIRRKISKKCNCTGFEPTYLVPKDMELSIILFRNCR